MIRSLIVSMRPKQMVKNAFVFGPLIFSNNLFSLEKFGASAVAFASFCFLAAAVYLLNDVVDLKRDREHPVKRHRPIASGELPASVALLASAVFAAATIAVSLWLNTYLTVILGFYLVNNVLYSFVLKRYVLLDVGSIAFGFVLRVLAGATAIQVDPSPWLIICTMTLACFLGFGKRRHELVLLNDNPQSHRSVLKEYSPQLLDQLLMITAAMAIITYAIYTIAPATVEHFGTTHLIYTVPFVLYGVFRYLYLVHVRFEGGDPAKVLLGDPPLIFNILLWLASCLMIVEGVV